MIYEVNLDIDPDIAKDYLAWLPGHVERMLRFDGFTHASIYKVDGPPDKVRVSVQYHLIGESHLQNYLKEAAEGMRAEAKTLFGDRFQATRRVMHRAD